MQLIRPNSDNGRVSLALVVECKHFIICWALTFISSEAFENSFRKCEHTSTATLPVCLPFNALFLYAFSTSLILPLGLSTISIVASSGAQLWLAFQLNCTTYATRAEPTLPSVFALTPPPSLPPNSVWLLHLVQIIEIRPRDDVDSSIRCFDSSRRQRHFSKARQKETFAILSKKCDCIYRLKTHSLVQYQHARQTQTIENVTQQKSRQIPLPLSSPTHSPNMEHWREADMGCMRDQRNGNRLKTKNFRISHSLQWLSSGQVLEARNNRFRIERMFSHTQTEQNRKHTIHAHLCWYCISVHWHKSQGTFKLLFVETTFTSKKYCMSCRMKDEWP